MAKLELFLLGTPQIYVAGQAVTGFNTRKDQALLAYLAVTGATHSRETLAGLLWSDLPEENARRNLRHSLSHLQKVIGPQWLKTERGVALTQDQPWSVDVRTLRSTIQNLTPSPMLAVGHTEPQTKETLIQVLQLYRGEFLQGFHLREAVHFEEWLVAQREELRLLTLRGLEAFVECCLAQGDYEPGLAATRRLLQLEPWSEPAHCLQMQLLAHSGRRALALAQYETCCKILAAELAVEPLPTTTALYQQIKAGKYNMPVTLGQFPALRSAYPEKTQGADAVLPTTKLDAGSPISHNLITLLAGFVGRQHELAFIRQRLATADCRLLTILGPGGMGKTALALAAGQHLLATQSADFPDGIFWVPLADVGAGDERQGALASDPIYGEAILRAIATQIGCPLVAGTAPSVQLQSYLRPRRLLLLLDNFEQLLAGTDAVITLLNNAPQIKVLLTSRARLNVRGESLLTLDKLSLPTATYQADVAAAQANPASPIGAEVWQASEAVAMFVQRAQQSNPFFTVDAATIGPIGQICHLVEGLPLGIELATSMLPLLSCTALAQDLARSLDVLVADTRDLPLEQRTLGAVFERSWRLLPPAAQGLLARLAIFPGSFHSEAAAQIVSASLAQLHHLLSQSLLSKAGEGRYILHCTVQAFARQKLDQWPEQIEPLQLHYARFYLEFLARLEQPQSEEVYATATEQIQADLENVRTAWRWSVDQGNLALLELGVGSLPDFYQTAGIYPEAIQLFEGALTAVRHAVALVPAATGDKRDGPRGHPRSGTTSWDGTAASRLLARLLCYTAQFYRLYPQANGVQQGETWANEALALGRRLADPALQALAYHELARQAQTRYDFSAMRLLAEQASTHAHQANLPQIVAESENDWGIALSLASHPLAGIQHFHTALAWLRQRPNPVLKVHIVSNLVLFHLVGHEYQAAYRYLQQRTLHPLFEDWVHYGTLLVTLGAYSQAQAEYAQGLALAQARHVPYWECWLHVGYGRLQRLCGDPSAAQIACRLALPMAQNTGNHSIVQWGLINLGHALAELGELAAATHCYQEAIDCQKGMHWFLLATDAHAGLAALALAQNDVMIAVTHVEAALAQLAHHGLAAAREPFTVYWTCVRVLQAAGDPRAQTVLATAYGALQAIANQLEEEPLRRSFLENVVANRELVAAACAAGNGLYVVPAVKPAVTSV